MKNADSKPSMLLNRRDLLKLAAGALGLGALTYTAGLLNQPEMIAQPTRSLPDYIDADLSFPVFRGPFLQSANMAAFLFSADASRLDLLCEHFLNFDPAARYRYTPLLSNLVVIFSDMLVSSADERDREKGLIPETELSFWAPVLAWKRTGAGYVPDHPAWFLPLLLVDDGSAIATGREVYGFNKQQALFQKPADIQTPEFKVSVVGFEKYGAAQKAALQPLLEFTSTSSTVQPAKWRDVDSARAGLLDMAQKKAEPIPGVPWLEYAARMATDPAPLVFLKQFRDAADTRKACYQALVEAPVKVESFRAGGLFAGGVEMLIHPLASHPVSTWLGLQGGAASLGAWLQLDFSLGSGKIY